METFSIKTTQFFRRNGEKGRYFIYILKTVMIWSAFVNCLCRMHKIEKIIMRERILTEKLKCYNINNMLKLWQTKKKQSLP